MGHTAGLGILKKRKIFLEWIKKKSEVRYVRYQMFQNTRIEICFFSLSFPFISIRIFFSTTFFWSYFCIFLLFACYLEVFLHTQLLIS